MSPPLISPMYSNGRGILDMANYSHYAEGLKHFQGPGPFYVAGAMSGTSLDGLDLALVSFTPATSGTRWRYSVVKHTCIAYEGTPWAAELSAAYDQPTQVQKGISAAYTTWLNAQLHAFLEDVHVDAIASHGHTVTHLPDQGLTVQIGNDPHLADGFHGIPVVCDFRVADVARGGQGAPLVPLADACLYSEYPICLNIGGFSNASWDIEGQRRAGDLGPANLLINHFAQRLGIPFDPGGQNAQKWTADTATLETLRQLPFYGQSFPKSLGREWVDQVVLPHFASLTDQTALATATTHAAWAICHGIQDAPLGIILATGGGALNDFLIAKIRIGSGRKVVIPTAVERDFKEAICFAFLGLLRLRGETNVWSSVTGSREDGCDGIIYV